jgi:hypothetical protein
VVSAQKIPDCPDDRLQACTAVRSRRLVKEALNLIMPKIPQAGAILIEFEELQQKPQPPRLRQNGCGAKIAANTKVIRKAAALDLRRQRSWNGAIGYELAALKKSAQATDHPTEVIIPGTVIAVSRLQPTQV